MNPPSERRFPLLPLAKADAGASPGAAAFLEDLIDACVMESYFREHMAERDLPFHVTVATLPGLNERKQGQWRGGGLVLA